MDVGEEPEEQVDELHFGMPVEAEPGVAEEVLPNGM
jgi:hypothetical protein